VARASDEASDEQTDTEVRDEGNSRLVSHVRYIRSHAESTLRAESTLKHQMLTKFGAVDGQRYGRLLKTTEPYGEWNMFVDIYGHNRR
jgi:hypothetical protein